MSFCPRKCTFVRRCRFWNREWTPMNANFLYTFWLSGRLSVFSFQFYMRTSFLIISTDYREMTDTNKSSTTPYYTYRVWQPIVWQKSSADFSYARIALWRCCASKIYAWARNFPFDNANSLWYCNLSAHSASNISKTSFERMDRFEIRWWIIRQSLSRGWSGGIYLPR